MQIEAKDFIQRLKKLSNEQENIDYIDIHSAFVNKADVLPSDIYHILSLYIIHAYPKSLESFIKKIVIPCENLEHSTLKLDLNILFSYNISTVNYSYDSRLKYRHSFSTKEHKDNILKVFNSLNLLNLEKHDFGDYHNIVEELILLEISDKKFIDTYIPFFMNRPDFGLQNEQKLKRINHFLPIIHEIKTIQLVDKLDSELPIKSITKHNKI